MKFKTKNSNADYIPSQNFFPFSFPTISFPFPLSCGEGVRRTGEVGESAEVDRGGGAWGGLI